MIWKWDIDIPNLPKNIKLSSWLPQQDLLGHNNLKVILLASVPLHKCTGIQVFVTHGGLGSLVEAIYHRAIIVGIPFR